MYLVAQAVHAVMQGLELLIYLEGVSGASAAATQGAAHAASSAAGPSTGSAGAHSPPPFTKLPPPGPRPTPHPPTTHPALFLPPLSKALAPCASLAHMNQQDVCLGPCHPPLFPHLRTPPTCIKTAFISGAPAHRLPSPLQHVQNMAHSAEPSSHNEHGTRTQGSAATFACSDKLVAKHRSQNKKAHVVVHITHDSRVAA